MNEDWKAEAEHWERQYRGLLWSDYRELRELREEVKRLRADKEPEPEGPTVIRRYQRCVTRIWAMFPNDPLGDDPAQFYVERLEALLNRGLLAPTQNNVKTWMAGIEGALLDALSRLDRGEIVEEQAAASAPAPDAWGTCKHHPAAEPGCGDCLRDLLTAPHITVCDTDGELCFEWCRGDEKFTLYAHPGGVLRVRSDGTIEDSSPAVLLNWLRRERANPCGDTSTSQASTNTATPPGSASTAGGTPASPPTAQSEPNASQDSYSKALLRVVVAARELRDDCSFACAICECDEGKGEPHREGCSRAALDLALAALDATQPAPRPSAEGAPCRWRGCPSATGVASLFCPAHEDRARRETEALQTLSSSVSGDERGAQFARDFGLSRGVGVTMALAFGDLRRETIEACAVVARNMSAHTLGERALREDTVVHIMALLAADGSSASEKP